MNLRKDHYLCKSAHVWLVSRIHCGVPEGAFVECWWRMIGMCEHVVYFMKRVNALSLCEYTFRFATPHLAIARVRCAMRGPSGAEQTHCYFPSVHPLLVVSLSLVTERGLTCSASLC